LKKIPEYLIYLFIFSLIIDASGFGYISRIPFLILPFKYLLLIAITVCSLFMVIRFFLTGTFPENHYAALILGILIIPLIFGTVGLIRGNEVWFTFKDTFGISFYLFALMFILFINKKEQINKLLVAFFAATTVVNCAVLALEFLLITKVISPAILNVFLVGNDLGFIFYSTEAFYRVMLRSGIFTQIGIILAIALLFLKNKGFRTKLFLYSFLVMSVASLICQDSRGFLVATIVAVMLMLAFHHRDRYKSAMILLIFIIAGILFVFLGQFGLFDGVPVIGRLYSTFIFDASEPSNYMRSVQLNYLLAKIFEHPFIGSGYGAMIYGYYDTPVFELDYLALIMKIGIIGFIYWFGLMVYLIKDALRSYFLCDDAFLRTVQMSFVFALISVFILSATDPYLYGILGNFCVILAIIVFNIVRSEINQQHA
jgi:hypothetical protein